MPYFRAIADGLLPQTQILTPDVEDSPSSAILTPLPPFLPSDTTGSDQTRVSVDGAKELKDPKDLEVRTPTTAAQLPGAPLLPIHVTTTHSSASGSKRSGSGKRKSGGTGSGWVRTGLRVHWARFLRHVRSGDDIGDSDSIAAGSSEEREVDEDEDGEPKKLDGNGVAAASVAPGHSRGPGMRQDSAGADGLRAEGVDDDADSVDEVVVDRAWGRGDSTDGDADSGGGDAGGAHTRSTGENAHSRRGAGELIGGSGSRASNGGRESPLGGVRPHRFWSLCLPLTIVRYRLWPQALVFFATRFYDDKAEAHYRKEVWFQSKALALWSSLFFVINWILGCALAPKPFALADNIFYFAIAPVLTLPIPFFVIFDFARDRPYLYHVFISISTWAWSIYQIIFIFVCGYYSSTHPTCGSRDFLSLFYYTSALQTIALFGLKLNRFPAMFGAVVFLVMAASMVIPSRIGWIRNAINFLIFQSFLLYIHYMKETGERRLFMLRDELKKQFKATQKAQINETKAAESKRRLTSYVRVPLNTALIAVQNMEASHTVPKDQEVEFQALSGSLSMMSKVLNDVLDFNRMDSGLLESVAMPYPLHGVMKSMFIPLRLATEARRLDFITELDESIDIVARRAAWESLSVQNKLQAGWETFEKYLEANPDEDGMVVGDEMRLRQIVTNLVSNACKFTPAGGALSVRTKLVAPAPSLLGLGLGAHGHGAANGEAGWKGEGVCTQHRVAGAETHAQCDPEKGECTGLSARSLDQHNASHRRGGPSMNRIVVRIEVSDTGYGIKAKDIKKGKLFSAFNQTEQGRLQGGKGTGLGLALVRHIVSLSGGRLGVKSKVGLGSTFWVELPLGVGTKAVSATLTASGSEQDSSTFVSRRASIAGQRARGLSTSRTSTSVERPLKPPHKDSQDAVNGNAKHSHKRPATSSALKSIMEQGGLVELKPTTQQADGIPTRAIGDPSTGTDTNNLGPPSPQDNDAEGQALAAQAGMPSTPTPISTVVRPSYVEIPKRPSFGPATSVPNTTPATPASLSSNSTITAPSPSPKPDPPLRVLVVDDDQLTRKLMRRMLQRLGCAVSTAENGQIAFDLITGEGRTPSSEAGEAAVTPLLQLLQVQSQPPPQSPSSPSASQEGEKHEYDSPRYELVLLDNQMPVLSGLDLVIKLRQMGRTDFVVGVTGNALLTDQQEYLEAGVDYVVTKPVFEAKLKGMLHIATERRKNTTSLRPTS